MRLKNIIKDLLFLIHKSRIKIYLIIVFFGAIFLAWCESDLIIKINSIFSNSSNSGSLLDKYQISQIIMLIISRFFISYLIIYFIFKSSKRLSCFIFNCELSKSVSNLYEELQDSPSEITASILISIRHFINTIQSFAYLFSSLCFLFLLGINILKMDNGLFLVQSLIWVILIYFLFLLLNSKIIKYYASKVRFFAKKVIDILSLLDNSRGFLKGSISAKNAYSQMFSSNQENLRITNTYQASFSLLPTLTIESLFYVIYIGYFLVEKNPEINTFLSQFTPFVSFLLLSSPKLFSILGKINIYTGLLATSIPHVNAILSIFNDTYNSKRAYKKNKNNFITFPHDETDELVVTTIPPNLELLKIKSNCISILEGKSGSGKSSLILNLINNRNCQFKNNYYLELYRQGHLYCFMNSNSSFFEGNILSNINMNQNSFNEDKLFQSLSISGFNQIEKLSNKGHNEMIDFLSSESIRSLSSGEKQRVAISRSILFGGKVLLFDEATSNLPFYEHKKIVLNLINSKLFDSFLFCSHHSNKFFKKDIKKTISIYNLDDINNKKV